MEKRKKYKKQKKSYRPKAKKDTRRTHAYYNWRKQIHERSNYTCQKCNRRHVKLEAHHLDSYNLFPKKRYWIRNGASLCCKCHREFHQKYGYGMNTREQYKEWINHLTPKKEKK